MQNLTLELYLLSNFNIAKSNYKFTYKMYKKYEKDKSNNNLIEYYKGVLAITRQILLQAAYDYKKLGKEKIQPNLSLEYYFSVNFSNAISNYKFSYYGFKTNKNTNLSQNYLGKLIATKEALLKAAHDLKHIKAA